MSPGAEIAEPPRRSAERLSSLFVEVIKNAVSFQLWREAWVPVERMSLPRFSIRRIFFKILGNAIRLTGFRLVKSVDWHAQERVFGRIWPIQADTMIGLPRLQNIQNCVETVLKENIPGDFIETGVWRGGATIFMRAILAAHGVTDRKVWLADSFAGLPKPDPAKYPQDKGDRHHVYDVLAISDDEVKENFKKYGLLDDQVVFLKGWFKDTLPTAPIDKLAVMRLDGDMYQSTIEALESLYPKLSPGGFCIIDDYALKGCKLAVDDFRRDRKITTPLQEIDWTGAFWRKEA
jgi:O-methyltransferase